MHYLIYSQSKKKKNQKIQYYPPSLMIKSYAYFLPIFMEEPKHTVHTTASHAPTLSDKCTTENTAAEIKTKS